MAKMEMSHLLREFAFEPMATQAQDIVQDSDRDIQATEVPY